MVFLIECEAEVVVGFAFFFFNDTATTEIYTLSLHDALPISLPGTDGPAGRAHAASGGRPAGAVAPESEEHTPELQSPCNLVCRLLLEKKTISSALPSASYTLSPWLTACVAVPSFLPLVTWLT